MPGPVKNAAVARLQTVITQLEPAQPVAFKRVCAGQKEDQARLEAALKFFQRMLKRLQVRAVGAAVGLFDIQIAGLLAERKVLLAVHGQREHTGVICKDAGCAVALVHIQVDHRNLQGFS